MYLKLQNLTRPNYNSITRHCRSWAPGPPSQVQARLYHEGLIWSAFTLWSQMHRNRRAGFHPELPRGGRLFCPLPAAEGRPVLPEARRGPVAQRVRTLLSAPSRGQSRGAVSAGGGVSPRRKRCSISIHSPVCPPGLPCPPPASCQGMRLEPCVPGAPGRVPSGRGQDGQGPGRLYVCVPCGQVDTELKTGDRDVVGATCALV